MLSTNIHLQQKPQSSSATRNFVLGDFFVVDVDSKAGINKIFVFLLESTISCSPQILC